MRVRVVAGEINFSVAVDDGLPTPSVPAPQVSDPTELFLGNAGTAMRPLTAVVCAGKGEFVMDGTPRMRERPIIDLVDGLKQVRLLLYLHR